MSTTAERRVDPVTLQIVATALATIADEMATTIFRTAHSTVVRDGLAAHDRRVGRAEDRRCHLVRDRRERVRDEATASLILERTG